MGHENSHLLSKKKNANFRLCNVSGYKTDLLEIQAEDPTLHVLFIPGNPGVVSFYTDFVESLYESLGGTASITAIGHISHTKKNWEHGRLFSLQEQIDHKMDFIKHELQDLEVPILLYHTMRNVLFMAMTEFRKLSETLDWAFLRGKKSQIAFLFGLDDHWGPMELFEEISKQVPDAVLAVEREGHTHAFSCTEAGASWVAQHVASLIRSQLSK